MTQQNYVLKPIGTVHVCDESFILEIETKYRAALEGLEGFSHIDVLWWSHFLDTAEQRSIVTCKQPYRKAPASVGIFATRSPLRPNPICLSVSEVTQVDAEQGLITLTYIDAEDGTPILDIKPYSPCIERVREVKTPEWNRHWPQWYEDSASFDWQSEFVNAR